MNTSKKVKKPVCLTQKGKETNGAGFDAEITVKNKLWRYGYHVEHKDNTNSYDLLVNNSKRVEVKTGKARFSKTKGIYWVIMLPYRGGYDVLAVLLKHPVLDDKILFFTKEKIELYFRDKTSITFSEHNKKRMNIASKSPYHALGKPKEALVDNST